MLHFLELKITCKYFFSNQLVVIFIINSCDHVQRPLLTSHYKRTIFDVSNRDKKQYVLRI